jgi:hypothetical protein
MDAQARRNVRLRSLTRSAAVVAASLGVLIYVGVSGLPATVLGLFVADVQSTVSPADGTPNDSASPTPPDQAPAPYAGGPVRTRTGAS